MNYAPDSTAPPAAGPPPPPQPPVLTDPPAPVAPFFPPQASIDTAQTVAARAAMVVRLEESGDLGPGSRFRRS